MSLIQVLMDQAVTGSLLQPHVISRFTPAEIRESIQQLVAAEQMDLAHALGDAGLSLYPNSEDMLAIGGLLCIMRQEWTQAIELLSELITLQGENTQPFTLVMLVRALRCNLEPARALEVVRIGLAMYPDQLELVAESLALEDYSAAVAGSEQSH